VKSERKLAVQVGAFVAVLGSLALVVLLLLGGERHLFTPRVVLHASFSDVQGLREGAPVWLSGVSIGQVKSVRFGERRVEVLLQVRARVLERIHEDSIARIDTQGLLGDKIVTITLGGAESAPVAANGWLRSVPPSDFNHLIAQAGEILEQATVVAKNAATASKALADPKTIEKFRNAIASMDSLLGEAAHGRGLAHALFYDPRTASSLQQIAKRIEHASGRIDQIVSAADEKMLHHVSLAAERVSEVAASINSSHVIPHLDRASGDLADVIAYVKAGQGTLGALIADPSAYERLVTLLGGANRSTLLRWMVRHAIQKGEKKVPPPPPPKPIEAKTPREQN
jgi:phospholipid/cholesterol/gamma-HCH transport system substrate-binding protein